jgi:hypothetical protein
MEFLHPPGRARHRAPHSDRNVISTSAMCWQVQADGLCVPRGTWLHHPRHRDGSASRLRAKACAGLHQVRAWTAPCPANAVRRLHEKRQFSTFHVERVAARCLRANRRCQTSTFHAARTQTSCRCMVSAREAQPTASTFHVEHRLTSRHPRCLRAKRRQRRPHSTRHMPRTSRRRTVPPCKGKTGATGLHASRGTLRSQLPARSASAKRQPAASTFHVERAPTSQLCTTPPPGAAASGSHVPAREFPALTTARLLRA